VDEARKAELEKVIADAQARAIAADEAHRDLVLELRAKHLGAGGREGHDFAIVNEDNDAGAGPIVLKLIDSTHNKKWMAADNSPESQHAYVSSAVVYPDAAAFNAIADKRPILLTRCVAALEALFGARRGDQQKKF